MKILWITEFFPASKKGEITGGVEARCFFVSKYLKKKHKLTIFSRSTDNWTAPTWQSFFTRAFFTFKTIVNGLLMDFDLVEGTNFTNHLAAALLGFLKNKPIVCWYPDVFVGQWFKNVGGVGIFGEMAERLLFKIPGINYLAISQTTKNKLIKNGVPGEKISVVYCGVEPTRIKSRIHYDVCAVSRLLKYKHLDDLITVTKNLKVVIVGQGPEKNKLQKMASEGVTFLGYLPAHKDVLKIMASSKVFCHPSTVEGFGIVVIEAMSLGIPAIVADIPVMREITYNGQGTLFFEPKNPKDLVLKIQRLLTDKKLYNQKVKEALILAQKYTWEKAARETEKVYENLLSH